jgi:hypothetical protein
MYLLSFCFHVFWVWERRMAQECFNLLCDVAGWRMTLKVFRNWAGWRMNLKLFGRRPDMALEGETVIMIAGWRM